MYKCSQPGEDLYCLSLVTNELAHQHATINQQLPTHAVAVSFRKPHPCFLPSRMWEGLSVNPQMAMDFPDSVLRFLHLNAGHHFISEIFRPEHQSYVCHCRLHTFLKIV